VKPLRILPGEPPPVPGVVLERSWRSRLDLKQEMLDAMTGALLARGWVEVDDLTWLSLCLDEVVANALLHGNEGDPALSVTITLGADQARWVVLVSDQGEGFSPELVPDSEAPESLLLEHGRGIRIMQEWIDELTYYRGGTCAWLSRHRADRVQPERP
jgi:anti-sigma regulatory factor (Ser/Thr protein kinase)